MEAGGYYGTDIKTLSKELGVTPPWLRKQISKGKGNIKRGQRPPSVTLDDL